MNITDKNCGICGKKFQNGENITGQVVPGDEFSDDYERYIHPECTGADAATIAMGLEKGIIHPVKLG